MVLNAEETRAADPSPEGFKAENIRRLYILCLQPKGETALPSQ